MAMETVSCLGLPNCIKLSNGSVDLIVTTAVGPRILFYGPAGRENDCRQDPIVRPEMSAHRNRRCDDCRRGEQHEQGDESQ